MGFVEPERLSSAVRFDTAMAALRAKADTSKRAQKNYQLFREARKHGQKAKFYGGFGKQATDESSDSDPNSDSSSS